MSKAKQKKAVYNETIIQELQTKYSFSRSYILKSIRGERTGSTPIKIQEEYKSLLSSSNQAIRQRINKL